MDNLIFSKMCLWDLDSISNILVSEFDDFWNYDIFKNELASKSSLYFVAKSSNEIVGFIGIKLVLDEADIMNIVVKKSFRGNHVGSFLLNNLLLEISNLNINKINLEVNCENTVAICLYKKFGFSEVGVRKKYYGDDSAILMTKVL